MVEGSPRRVALRLTDVVKTYPGVTALRGVSLEILEGEVHALVGENGAGKSTLMAVAAGATSPDSGSVTICDEPLIRASPAAAQSLGLAIVYQQPAILDDLTVIENLLLAVPRRLRPRPSGAAAWCRSRLDDAGLEVDPEARIGELTVAGRQLLEIAKALALEPRVLILDEPTESLSAAERDRLFDRIDQLRTGGTAVLYISHRLPEVKRVADRVSVLRDGALRGTAPAGEMSEADVLALIVGRSVDRLFPAKRDPASGPGALVLEAHALRSERFGPVDLRLAATEIVGLAGVEGQGQHEFLRALGGLATVHSGRVSVADQAVDLHDPARARQHGIGYLPADRHREGLFDSLSVRENAALGVLPRAAVAGFVRREREVALVQPQLQRMDVRAPSLESPVATLSGGNQQKVMLARVLLDEPRVILADEPTRGVDVGARAEIYGVLREAANAGRGVVIVSSDALELEGLCDRVLVFSRGVIVAELEGDAITETAIARAAITSTAEVAGATESARRSLRLQRFAAGDYAPAVILAIVTVLLAVAAGFVNDRFFTERNLTSMLLLASAVIFVSLGQLVVIISGGFDLSVGPLTGLTVITLSYLAVPGSPPLVWLAAVAILAVLVGAANGLLVTRIRLTPVIATLVTFTVIQGVALFLRPQPGGLIDQGLLARFKTSFGPMPLAFLVAVALALVGEWLLRRSHAGRTLRAVGSSESRAYRLGAHVRSTRLAAYVLCSLFAVLGGLMLASQTGIGDASLGTSYSLTSITAVVLGGASISGGRGSFIGALVGALLLQEIVTATSFLGLGTAWQSWLPGVLILVSAAIYSRARRERAPRASVGGTGQRSVVAAA